MVLLLAADAAAAAPEWTLAEPGDRVTLVKRSSGSETYLVVQRRSLAGDFLLTSGNQAARVYQIFVGTKRQLIIIDSERVALADGTGRRLAGTTFATADLERQLRRRVVLAPARDGEPSARAAGVPIVGALIAIKKGLEACEKLEKTFVLRPVARACKDFYERKFFKLVAKIAGVKLATAMLTCSQAMPAKTPPLVRQIAKMLCG